MNLLPVQQKKSKEPGDAVAMVQARRDFLAAGHYQPLRSAVVDMLKPLQPASLVDIGCGEGYYTHAMAKWVSDVVGLDIAKPAIRYAAKSDKKIQWLVANGAHLPLADHSADMVTSLFSPLPVEEMARVLKPGGYLLMVTPGANHLGSIRSALFESLIPHQPDKFLQHLAPRFTLIQREEIRFPLTLPQAALRLVLMMTPYAWRAKAEQRAAVEARESMDTEAEFTIFLLKEVSPEQETTTDQP